jgi:hypothetical protein
MVADWVLDPPTLPISFRRALWWLVYPFAWLVYVLVRGPMAEWYPYPFLDPANGGYASVAVYGVAIFVGMVAIVWAVVAAGNAMAERRPAGSSFAS